MTDYPIGLGDVALDLAQGRPVHVVGVSDMTAAEWSDANNYDLAGNYANARFETSDDDRVFDCVYCSSAKSEPSKTYAFPESRLLRLETEAADDGRPVYQRVVVDVLTDVFFQADATDALAERLEGAYGSELIDEARELADVEHRFGDGGDDV